MSDETKRSVGRPRLNEGNYTESYYSTKRCGELLTSLCEKFNQPKGAVIEAGLEELAARKGVKIE